VNTPRIPKVGPVPGHLQRLAKSLDAVIDIINRGHTVESDTIGIERLPDGRVRLFQKTTPGPYAINPPVQPGDLPGISIASEVSFSNSGTPAAANVIFTEDLHAP
jgi:hypothetical protein